jgi:hypothetical protein
MEGRKSSVARLRSPASASRFGARGGASFRPVTLSREMRKQLTDRTYTKRRAQPGAEDSMMRLTTHKKLHQLRVTSWGSSFSAILVLPMLAVP